MMTTKSKLNNYHCSEVIVTVILEEVSGDQFRTLNNFRPCRRAGPVPTGVGGSTVQIQNRPAETSAETASLLIIDINVVL